MLPLDEPYVYQGIEYKTAENFYQAMKLPKDRLDLRAEIAAMNPFKSKTSIRDKNKYSWREDWEENKLKVMDHILRIKFAPGTSWVQKLLETGDEEIVEWNNWNDEFWGRNPNTLKGENWLGKLLMVIRSDLQNNYNAFLIKPTPTRIVHCQKAKFTKYVGRPKVGQPWGFGNPFVIGSDGDRAKVINKMKEWLDTGETFGNIDATPERRQWILDNVQSLKGEVLGCWCDYPKEDCHGRILINKINEITKPTLITNNLKTLDNIYNLPSTQSKEQAVRSILKQNEK